MSVLPRTARTARLVYGCDDRPGFARHGRQGHFHYVDTRGRRLHSPRTLGRIRRLVIPPAWNRVWINPRARGHLQASGRDARGRKQYVYHVDWQAARDAIKFASLVAFATALPRLRRAVRASLRRPHLDRERVIAVVVRLLETSLIRIGNDEYARQNGSFGLTTLRQRHVKTHGGRIQFSFPGKSGRRHDINVANRQLARQVQRIQELPGQELFHYLDAEGRCRRLRSDDVNAYLSTHLGGDFTAKDFRTWGGTVLAALELAQHPPPASGTEAKRVLATAMRVVAARLGNTPAVARQSYVHPAVPAAFRAGRLPVLPSPDTWPRPRYRGGLSRVEQKILRLLRDAPRRSR